MAKAKPKVVAFVSDPHVGGTTALHPEEGTDLPDGGRYLPSKEQIFLWKGWNKFWWRVGEIVREHKGLLWQVYNGDLFEGDHHGTSQIISRDMNVQEWIADRVFDVPRRMNPAKVLVVKGTETHVGSTEETRARWFGIKRVEREHGSNNFSWHHLRMNVHGVRFDVQHHGARMGQLPWTTQNGLNSTANQIRMECLNKGDYDQWPHYAVRSHIHRKGDSGDQGPHRTRLLVTPSFQFKTGFGYKVTGGGAGYQDFGGCVVVVFPDGTSTVEWITFEPELPTAVTT